LLPCSADPKWARSILLSTLEVQPSVAVIVAVLDPDASETLAGLELSSIVGLSSSSTSTPMGFRRSSYLVSSLDAVRTTSALWSEQSLSGVPLTVAV